MKTIKSDNWVIRKPTPKVLQQFRIFCDVTHPRDMNRRMRNMLIEFSRVMDKEDPDNLELLTDLHHLFELLDVIECELMPFPR